MDTPHTVLTGHTSPETAFLVEDYPYGFRLRCQIRYWIETKAGHGQRMVSQTTNPKRPGLVWNQPKASTYSRLRVLYREADTGHVKGAALDIYADPAKVDAFEATYAAALTDEYSQKTLKLIRSVNAATTARFAAAPVAEDPSVAANIADQRAHRDAKADAAAPLAVGDRVVWHDPDHDLATGPGTVARVDEEIIALAMDDGGEAEVLAHELTPAEPKAGR